MAEYTLAWDQSGEKFYEAGVDHGVLYVHDGTKYGEGVVWNGLVSVSEAPEGAESNKQYADNIAYLNLVSAEEFKATVEAFTYPDEWAACDGSKQVAKGVYAGQQNRSMFGMCYRTKIGNDTGGQDLAYKLHLVYGATAKPSERSYSTINDSPEAITFSWEIDTVPTPVKAAGVKPTAAITIDSRKTDASKLEALEKKLYGDKAGTGDAKKAMLPTIDEVIALMGADTSPGVGG